MTADPLAPPFIDPRISDPAALKYAQGAETRRRPVAIPKYTEPVAGGADTMIPRLDQEGDGRTMSEVARQQRPLAPSPADAERLGNILGGMPQVVGTGGIIEGSAHQTPAADPRVAQGAPTTGILASDVLPEAAQQDPAFQSGGGAMYAMNQPHLARKYGVIRNGQHVPGQMLANAQRQATSRTASGKPASSPIRDETLAQLETLKNFNERRLREEQGESADERIEENALKGPAGGAGKTERQLSEQEKKAVLDEMDDFDISRVRNAMFKDLLNNDEQRSIIEKRLKPLDLTQLITTGRVIQTVPVKPGVFEPIFQSYSGEEDLCIKRLLGEESRSNNITDQYALDKYSLMGLTVSLRGVNKALLPEYRDSNGNFDDEAFWKKYNIIARYDFHMLASLVANWFWFDIRVRKLWRAEDLGNG